MQLPRSSGILLHITSLPGPYGIGDMGPAAYRFVDFLARTKQRIWQVLPLVPVGMGNSPYSSPSTFAGNPLLISPDRLLEQGLLDREDLANPPAFPADTVDFKRVIPYKHRLLRRAFEHFENGRSPYSTTEFERYCEQESEWLEDYALFMALREQFEQRPWTEWPRPLALRHDEALAKARKQHGRRIRMHKFWQFIFDRQWTALKEYCYAHQIRLFGDLPIYVAHNSADVWSQPDLFHLDEEGEPTVVAGVPPDYFSETGQRWGNPIYRWDLMHKRGYRWWKRRLTSTLNQVDLVRLDHFRGFEAYWEIPAEEETAVNGHWVDGPGADLFNALREEVSPLPVIAENLGDITQGVIDLMHAFNFPGMAVLQFAFHDRESDFLPHNFSRNLVAYTGTHDNNTFVGWWNDKSELSGEARTFARQYLPPHDADAVHWSGIRLLMASVANSVVIPLQDVLGLEAEARMNTPGQGHANWTWRFRDEQIDEATVRRLRMLTDTYGRTASPTAQKVQETTPDHSTA